MLSACPRCGATISCRCRISTLQPGEKFVPPATVKRCDTCDHWSEGAAIRVIGSVDVIGHSGDCRRHAPVVTVNRFDVAQTKWPVTINEDRCGDWEKASS